MVTFTYPFTSPTISIDLPNPRLGDADEHMEPIVIDFAYSARIYTYQQVPGQRKLLLTWNNLTFTQHANLQKFVFTAVNSDCGYLDHNSNQWRGIILNDPVDLVSNRKDLLSVSLEFNGNIWGT